MKENVARRIILAIAVGLLAAAVGGACSTFTGDGEAEMDGGSPDAPSGGEDSSIGAPDARDTADAAGAGDAADAYQATPLIHVTGASSPFSIEAHEVTVAQYNYFKGNFPTPLTFPTDKCPTKTTLGPPAGHCGNTYANDDPVTCIDWCDANAYCRAIGRHLCGAVNGAPLPIASRNDPGLDEWYYACRGPQGLTWPYGDAGAQSTCWTDQGGNGQPVNVASITTCVGAEQGLHDMSGNAAEWVDSCVAGSCMVRGGSYFYTFKGATCDATSNNADPSNSYPDIGFRCCTEP